ncbi:MAG: SCO family protein [Verrucomicrobiota bacterium]|nr:SCO family protein [Verrucomicrobiota bacterium]MCC6822938.1 SCO family protein [Limisphaerales bacterium]
MRCWNLLLPLGLILGTLSCEKKSSEAGPGPAQSASATPAGTNTQIFQVKGVIVKLLPAEQIVHIQHEKIPGYMAAMTMPFAVKDTNELAGLNAGDAVTFRMLVTEDDGWIDQIKKLDGPAPVNKLPPNAPFRIVRDVEQLNLGDTLPEYHFTNQLGQAVSLSQFRGQALAITFVFTRCPFPTFCPLMSNNFRATQDALLKNPSAPTNWHLLTLTFDPEFDTPDKLKNYAAIYGCQPQHWSFLTGALIDVTALGEQFGLMFWRDPQTGISHNLRTIIVDAQGHVQKIITENKWTPTELVTEIVKAAQVGK